MPFSNESIELASQLRDAMQRLQSLTPDTPAQEQHRDTLVAQAETCVNYLVEQQDTGGLLDQAVTLLDDITAFSGDPTTEP
jgi:hypothetical protein